MKKIVMILSVAATLLVGCDKGFESVSEPTLTLSTEQNTYCTQEPVVFKIDSDADYLSFYSGERGNDYLYAQQERIYKGEAFITFNTAFQAGAQWKTQAEEDVEKKILRFFYSTDFSGVNTIEEVEKATWKELTTQFEWPTARATNAKVLSQTTPAGVLKLDELIPAEDLAKPIYFSFRYKIDAYEEALNNARSRASVMNFQIYTKNDEVNVTSNLMTQANAGWTLVQKGYHTDSGNYAPVVESNYIWFDCDGGLPIERICWAVSAPVVIDTEVNIGCDYGVGIKSFPDEPIESYTYTYAEPGTYEVVVVAANVDHEGNRMEKSEKVTIKVVDQGFADIEQPEDGQW
ncbi:MAG: DUF5017 domain-containing protein [Tidjanibacter sp.]|nr:DUF5017 domain-containing protein [Tidjanibacter sp.]